MDIPQALNICKELQSDAHGLLAKGTNEKTNPGSEECYRDIMLRMKKIAEAIYPNPEKFLSDHDSYKTNSSERDGYSISGNFDGQIRVTLRFIGAIVDWLNIKNIEGNQSNKINKIETQIIEKDKEVQRRGKVVDTKIHGASIEMIDRLRRELKCSTDIKSDIIEIKNELKEIKKFLSLQIKDFDKQEAV